MSDGFFEEESGPVTYAAPESLPVNLSSGGKLSAPPTLRVTDYTMEDTLKLSTATASTIIQNLIEVLQARVQDEFDVRLLHENEFEEILLSLYVNFWSPMLLSYPYPWTEEDLEGLPEDEAEEIRKGVRKLTVAIDLRKVQIDEIVEKFKEPIVIDLGSKKIGVRLPRVGDFLLVEEQVKKKFAVQDKRFSDIRFLQEQGEDLTKRVDSDRLSPYNNYQRERAVYFLALKQAILIQFVEVNGERHKLSSFEEKYQEYRGLPKRFWNVLSSEIEKIKFGIDHNVEMISPITKKKVIRRCLFQVLDFISTDGVSDDSGYTVSFGD